MNDRKKTPWKVITVLVFLILALTFLPDILREDEQEELISDPNEPFYGKLCVVYPLRNGSRFDIVANDSNDPRPGINEGLKILEDQGYVVLSTRTMEMFRKK